MTYIRRAALFGFAFLGLLPQMVYAQEFAPAPSPGEMPPNMMPLSPTPPPGAQQAPMQAQAPAYTQQQIDQLLAPIALYPDPLVAQILMASTYPLEVVDAHRWLQNPQNAALKGDQLQAALAQAPWDPSVKSLVAFPQVLAMMDSHLQWTEQLGDAFLANQAGVSESVQHLRQMAQSSGNLTSTPQQTVSAQDGAIMIEPPTPQTVYVPYYNPQVVYGTWPWAAYPPYYFPPPPGYVFYNEGLFGFGVGIIIADWLWGWDRWDWRNHRIDIDEHRWTDLNRGRPGPAGGVWQHEADHRHGVPYHSETTRAQFGGAQVQTRSNFRGYFNQPQTRGADQARATETARPNAAQYPGASHFERPAAQGSSFQPHNAAPTERHSQTFAPQNVQPQRQMQAPMAQQRNVAPMQQRSAPVFESFSRGADVHTQSTRGATSRASMPRAAPAARSAPASAPSGGGNRGGGGQHGGDGRNH